MNDLISRQAAIDALEDAKKIYVDRKVIIAKMQDIINNLPPAQTETVCIAKVTLSDEQIQEAVEKLKNEAVQVLPSADAVEVVRCKYCDFWNDWDSAGKESLGNHVCSCAYWTREDGPVVYTADTDFCSNGDRRGEEG